MVFETDCYEAEPAGDALKRNDRIGSKAHGDDWPLPGIGIPLAAFRI